MTVNNGHEPAMNKVANASKSAKRIVLTGDLSDDLRAMLRSAELLRHSDGQDLTSAFKDIRLASGEQAEIYVELDWERAISALKEGDSTHGILFYEAPQKRMAEAIGRGESLQAAISEYKNYAASILQHYRGHRRQLTMLDSEATLSNPNQAIKAIEKHTSVRCANPVSLPNRSLLANADVLAHMTATSAVHEHYDLKLLVNELEAGSVILPSHEAPSHSQRLLELRDELETAAKDSRCKESENELLLLQLHQIQEELETYYNKYQELENSIAALRDSSSKEIETYYNKYQELENSIAALRDSSSKEIETYYNKYQELENSIAALRDSTSWKLTAPLRRFAGIILRLKN
jgi:hypothetical protein